MPDRDLVVDADGHVLEPRDTWLRYLEPMYRDRAIEIQLDSDGFEVLVIDGKPRELSRGRLAALGGIGMEPGELFAKGRLRYEEGCPAGGYDPAARLEIMDDEEIDAVLLYPTIGIGWEGHVSDGALATAYARAYNRWLVDFCSHDRQRLVPIAHISLLEPEGAIEELKRARRAGAAGVFLSPDPGSRGGKRLDDPAFSRFFQTVEDLDVPIAFHVVSRERACLPDWLEIGVDSFDGGLFAFTFLGLEVMCAFTQMLSSGMFERHPRLRCAVLEAGSNWITAWLDRMDHKYETLREFSQLKMPPSEYFRRQCLISAEPDESITEAVVEHLGAEHVIWASDYPHVDASFGVVRQIREKLGKLSREDQRRVLGENAARFYGLAPASD